MPKAVYWFPKQYGYVTDWSDTTCTIDTKLDGPFLEERSSFKMLGDLIRSMKFLSPKVALYLYISVALYHTALHVILLKYLG